MIEPAPKYLWHELVLRKQVLRAYRIRETKQILHVRHRSPDLGSVVEVVVERNYDFPPRISEVVSRIDPPLRAVDLGANIGMFGLRLLAQRPDSRLVAVEPDPSNAKVLRATIMASGCPHWSVIEACAAPADGTVRFKAGDYTASRVSEEGDPFPAVDIFPILADADLIKIDIEGSERALLGDARFAALDARVVYLEYHPPHPRWLITELLAAAGYTVEPFEEHHPGYGELWAWK